jgi:hypothetical protein
MEHVFECNPLVAWPVNPSRDAAAQREWRPDFEAIRELLEEFGAGVIVGLMIGLSFHDDLFFLL